MEAAEEKVVAERHYAEVAEQVESVASPAAQVSMCVRERERVSV